MLGGILRDTYLTASSPSHIKGLSSKVVDTSQIHVRVKGGSGAEGPAIFDSAIALLQGLYPPDPSNKITLANDTVVTSPLGGYQYVPGWFISIVRNQCLIEALFQLKPSNPSTTVLLKAGPTARYGSYLNFSMYRLISPP